MRTILVSGAVSVMVNFTQRCLLLLFSKSDDAADQRLKVCSNQLKEKPLITAIPTRVIQQLTKRLPVKGQGLVVVQMTAIRAAPSLSSGVIDVIQVHLQTAPSVR